MASNLAGGSCSEAGSKPGEGGAALSSTIAQHYNQLPEKGLVDRAKSRIFFMRNFHNWVKAAVLSDMLQRVKQAKPSNSSEGIRVLDLCCGKGGDLLKFKQGRIDHLVCADIAQESIEQCRQRYQDMARRGRVERFAPKEFSAQFITADCTKQRLKDLYDAPDLAFDLCSCQFSFHYSFESYEQADMMLRNACECIAPGGYFIASTTNSYELVKRLKASGNLTFGNDLYSISFTSKDEFPLFGCRYDFTLDEVVNCPEFLVYFPALEQMARRYGMELVFCKTFADLVDEYKELQGQRMLLGRMKALEAYPAEECAQLTSDNPRDYDHIRRVFNEKFGECGEGGRVDDIPWSARLGTLSLAEWEVSSMYLMCVFQKQNT